MAESAGQSENTGQHNDLLTTKEDLVISIKKEVEVLVKPEPHECLVCAVRSKDSYDVFCTKTSASGASLHSFLSKFTNNDLGSAQQTPKYVCKSCFDLINVLEQAEIEYNKLKETFESIISKNPLFQMSSVQPIRLESVKNELGGQNINASFDDYDNLDSEDEPLSLTKKKRRKPAKKRKKPTPVKRKTKVKQPQDESWECGECGARGAAGGADAEAAHKIAAHVMDDAAALTVKKEDSSDGSQNQYNGFEPKIEMDMDIDDFGDGIGEDDDSSNFVPDEEDGKSTKKNKLVLGRLKSKAAPVQKKPRKPRESKVLHKCDECDAKYASLARLEQHKLKHDGSKPPYICEVCGAHYKHKRACDIHIQLHKGISDWKCEECNKLFPSKGALQRHNNIHTGKLNYQCDLCGKSFIHTSSFKMHKLSHSGVKPHACDVCGLALMTRSHLKRHKRVHSGEKRHECTICGKRFSERYNLAAHSKSHEAGAGAALPQLPRRHLFRCPFCPDRFERRYMLERHMSVVHGRALERPPPTPRNTMSKLLKAQAQGPRRPPDTDSKDDRSPDSRSTPISVPQKLIAQLSSQSSAAATSWSSAYAEFNLRAEFPH
ncbi:zinc finger protein 773 [Ostrinia nubilalis]|uniref:zinc finger protein 773-like n=1 Tax=Ostrinia furnacalis TaxID=93504 RepID=UPI001039AE71|nr:zinc finger protein 773-like [Ostrinia furnacalis]